MTHFDFLILLPGIGTFLAVARIFQFAAQLLVRRPAVKPTLMHTLWMLALLTLSFQSWFFLVEWREADAIRHLWQYPLLFIYPFCQYVIAVILCPTPEEQGFRRLDVQLERHGQVFYFMVGLMLVATGLESTFITRPAGIELKYPLENWTRYLWGTAMASVGWWLPAGPRRELVAMGLLVLAEIWLLIMSFGGF